MKLEQYYLGCLSHASYFLADERTKQAVVVDPQRDVERYLEEATRGGYTIRYVFLTHFHADFVAGHLELARRAGATIGLGTAATAEYAFQGFKDGERLQLGDLELQVLHTPGHTPEGITLVARDLSEPARPAAALTGDTLFIGDVGRPDLMASVGVTAEQLAGQLYDSVHQKLLQLPDETLVLPAHGAGSMCGKQLSSEKQSTIGVQRKYNYALQPMTKEEFIKLVTADQPEAPAYFATDAKLNKSDRPTMEQAMAQARKGLPLDEVLRLQNQGAQLLDARDPVAFEGAHLKGALNVGLSGSFATWAGTVLDHGRPVVVVAEPGREDEATTRLMRVGFDRIAGFLEGGMVAAQARPELLQSTDRITAATLAEALARGDAPPILDVRNATERAAKSIPGSVHVPLQQLVKRIAEVPKVPKLVVHCASGYRSAVAASVLEHHGFEGVVDLVGGYNAFEASAAAPR